MRPVFSPASLNRGQPDCAADEPALSPRQHRQLAHALLFVTPALWAVNYVVGRMAADSVAPHALALGRWLLAASLMGAIGWRELIEKRAAIVGEWRQFVVFGLLGMWICGAFVYIGARTTTAGNIGLIFGISPVLIALCSALWLKEVFGRVQGAGLALALAGVVHVVVKGDWSALAALRFTAGDLWILVAAIAWTAYAVLLKAWPSAFGPAARLALTCVAGVTILLPFAVIEALWFAPTRVTWSGFGFMLVLALFPGFGAYLAYAYMQRELGAARVGVTLYLVPIYSVVMGHLALGEPVRGFHFLAGALILAGIFLATRSARA